MRRTLLTLVCCLMLAAPKENQNIPAVASSDVPLTHKRIQVIQPGQWVKADNPAEEDDTEFGKDVDPATWKLLTLDAPKLDGTTARVQLLRPTFWLTLQQATVGNTLYISVPECGIQGDATLLQIDDCPLIKPRPGPGFQIVTGTYRHEAAQTLDISIEGESKPIGTTPNHPFWSVDRQAFVRADSLTVGERLQNLNGVTTVTNITPRGPPEPVYNLEVQVKHTYYVADSGVLVHNGRGGPCPIDDAIESGQLSVVSPHRAGVSRGSNFHEHHVFPQEHRRLFSKRGIDVDDFVIDLDVATHSAIHGGANWKLARRIWKGEWNARIMTDLKLATRLKGSRLTPEEIISVGENLMNQYGLSGAFKRYTRAQKK